MGRVWRRLSSMTVLLLIFVFQSFGADHWSVGLTSNDERIDAIVISGASPSAPTVLLVGGLQGKDPAVDIVIHEAEAFDAIPQDRRPFRLIAVPLANPGGRPLQFPPIGTAYKENVESHVFWRWIGVQAPILS